MAHSNGGPMPVLHDAANSPPSQYFADLLEQVRYLCGCSAVGVNAQVTEA
jgi:hypothetical protein